MKLFSRITLLIIFAVTLFKSNLFAQNLVPMPIPDNLILDDLEITEDQIISSYNSMKIGNYDGQTSSNVDISINAQANFIASQSIIISEETNVSVLSSAAEGVFEILPNDMTAAWFAPEYPGFVPKYTKLELGFGLEQFEVQIQNFKNHIQPSLNPFNPEEMDCYMIFKRPDGSQKRVNSFYYEQFMVSSNNWLPDGTEYPWRIRFAPDLVGDWSCTFHAEVSGQNIVSKTISFECTDSFRNGYLKTDGRYLAYEEGGGPFFTKGHNLYSSGGYQQRPDDWQLYKEAFNDLADAGGNFTRIELGAQNALPYWKPQHSASPSPPEHDNYFLKMDQMWEYDQVIDICDVRQIYFIMFRHHVEIQDGAADPWDGVSWPKNPINIAFNLQSREEFLSNEDAVKWQNYCLRYVFARWGYTPKFAFHSYSEVDNWVQNFEIDHGLSEAQASLYDDDQLASLRYENKSLPFFNFVQSQEDYITNQLGQDKMMFTNSYADLHTYELQTGRFFYNDDLISFHKYYVDKAFNWEARYDKFEAIREAYPDKPILHEESGYTIGGCKPGHDTDWDGIIDTPIDCDGNGDFSDVSNYENFGRVMNCTSIDLKSAVWASSMMGGIGTSMDYFWMFVHISPGALDYYSAIDSFFDNENLGVWNYDIKKDKESAVANIFNTPGPLHNCDLETYYMVSANKERVLGWVHNSSHYWRNYTHLPCMDQIIFNEGVVDNPGFKANGDAIDNYPLDYNFNSEDFLDKHSPDGTDSFSGSFKISGLRASGIGGLEIYDVEIYNTTTGDLVPFGDSEVTASILGKAEIQVPPMDNQNPDYAYKVIFNRTEPLINLSQEEIEEVIAQESNIDRNGNILSDPNNEEMNMDVTLYPNPVSDVLVLEGLPEGIEAEVYNSFGSLVSIECVITQESRVFDVSELASGVYYILIKSLEPASIRFIKN